MIDGNAFQKYGTDYETVLGMLRCIVFKIAGGHRNREYIEDLISEGWLIICELMREYDPERGKLTTYLWMPVYGALLRYSVKKNHLIRQYDEEEEKPLISTDNIANSGVFDGNPWMMSPDVVYEKKERVRVYHTVVANHQEEVREYTRKTPKCADLSTRKDISRKRMRAIRKLQNTAQAIWSSI